MDNNQNSTKRNTLPTIQKKGQSNLGPVWYMCLKTENCCLKTFMEICVGEKVR